MGFATPKELAEQYTKIYGPCRKKTKKACEDLEYFDWFVRGVANVIQDDMFQYRFVIKYHKNIQFNDGVVVWATEVAHIYLGRKPNPDFQKNSFLAVEQAYYDRFIDSRKS